MRVVARARSALMRAILRCSATRLSMSVFARREDLERVDELLPVAALFVDRLEDRGRFRAQLRMLRAALRAPRARLRAARRGRGSRGSSRARPPRRRCASRALAEAELEIDELRFADVELDAPAQERRRTAPSVRAARRDDRARRAPARRSARPRAPRRRCRSRVSTSFDLGLVELRDLVVDLLLLGRLDGRDRASSRRSRGAR